jgi:hypothetical protein
VDAEQFADLVELRLIEDVSKGLSLGEAQELAARLNAPPHLPEMAFNVMKHRANLLGTLYPFHVATVGVRRVDRPGSANYACLLALSHRAGAPQLAAAALTFERIVVAAVPELLGDRAQAIRFGWPSDVRPPRPTDFPAAVRWLAQQMGTTMGVGYRPPRRQDGGVDVVVWRKFADGRPGFPIILVQATLERDAIHKSADIDLRLWSTWLRWDVDPLTALALPYTIARREDWNEMSQRTIVLDRLRLVELLGPLTPPAVADYLRLRGSPDVG